MVGPRSYDLLYRLGAPWEIGPRSELVGLVEGGRLTPTGLAPGRAVDLGCGSGANAVFLAEHGFEVTGIDFSPTALEKARRLADAHGVGQRVRLVRGDLTVATIPDGFGPFDLLVDYGTLDDLRGEARRRMAASVVRLARPGARFVLWCFYGHRSELPWISFTGPSKLFAGLAPGEEVTLFGAAFDAERLPEPPVGSGSACFLFTRRPSN